MCILLVDDDAGLRNCLRDELEMMCSSRVIVIACDGLEALTILETMPTCVFVLSDIQMPKMDGLQLLAKIKAIRPDLPVILMSGNPSFTADDVCKRGGVTLLRKPFAQGDLEKTVRTLTAA